MKLRLHFLIAMITAFSGCDTIDTLTGKTSHKILETDIIEKPDENLSYNLQDPPHGEVIYLEALFKGSLIIKNNCLLLQSDHEIYNPIWPHDVSLARVNGVLSIIRNNNILLNTEKLLEIGGGELPADTELMKKHAVPELCHYKFWLVGEIIGNY